MTCLSLPKKVIHQSNGLNQSATWNLEITEGAVTQPLKQVSDPYSIPATGGHTPSAVSPLAPKGGCVGMLVTS